MLEIQDPARVCASLNNPNGVEGKTGEEDLPHKATLKSEKDCSQLSELTREC